MVDSFKSTLDEVREADLLLHIVDISHPDFEEQIEVVNKTLADIGAAGKPMILVFNKIDAYTYIEKAADDLTPRTKENLTLEELMKTWMAKMPLYFCPRKNQYGGTEECSLSACEGIARAEVPL